MVGKSPDWRDFVPATLATIFIVSQIIVGIYLLQEIDQVQILANLGVAVYAISGLVFGCLPVFEFRRRGGVAKGKSYVYTTVLVDTGIYSVVRHPQYVTFMMWAIGGMLLFQHRVPILLGIPIFPLIYLDMIQADKGAIEKFGDEYRAYMERVPRANFLLGLLRLYRGRGKRPQANG
jgi:protein-S-isoprenylcysteine O-methyltransferase Ste14